MKNLHLTLIALLAITAFASCGDDESTSSCTQADFVGSYTLVGDSTCATDTTLSAPLSFSLTAGPTEDIVLENGESDLELPISDCEAKDDFITYTLDGNNMTSRIGTCEWTYTKN